MASPVFVWPLHLLGGVYADLHAGLPLSSGFEMMHTNLEVDGVRGDQITLFFDFGSPLGPDGRINIAASGGRYPGGAEAERSAVAAMVQALRTQYQLFATDYNYVAISEKRALYNAMKISLDGFLGAYGDMERSLKGAHSDLVALCSDVSDWLARRHPATPISETVAVHDFHASLTLHATDVAHDVTHASQLVDTMIHRDAVPQEQRRFDETVPTPTPIIWDRSYYVLRTIYDQAVKKFNCIVSPIRFVQSEDGQYRGTIDLSAEPHMFWGPPDPAKIVAKAKLLYTVIKYVNEKMRCPIIDMHYVVRQHQETFICRFDHKMVGIWRCGERLKRLMDSTGDIFARDNAELTPKMSDNACSDAVLQYIQSFSSKLRHSKGSFDAAWHRLVDLKEDKASVQARLDAAA